MATYTMKLLADSSLPHLACFDGLFDITSYSNLDELRGALPQQDILLCRSNLTVNAALLDTSPIQCVATASSGTDHIDEAYLQQRGIQLLSAKGCNADAVADYSLSCLAWLIQHGYRLPSPIGILGLGEVGTRVAARLNALSFSVLSYDPPKSLRETAFRSCSLHDLTQCSVLFIHASLHTSQPHPSSHLINQALLKQLPPGCIILNAARGGIVDEKAVLSCGESITYCTDVYANEPQIDPKIIDCATLCTPHIAGHSIEAKANAMYYLFDQLNALYTLSPGPLHPDTTATRSRLNPNKPWYAAILEHYNPYLETQLLKQASNKTTAFLSARAAHRTRHDLIWPF